MDSDSLTLRSRKVFAIQTTIQHRGWGRILFEHCARVFVERGHCTIDLVRVL